VSLPPAKGMVRRLAISDLDAVLAIQESSREASQWSREGYARAAAGEFPAWVAEESGGVAGFLVVRTAADEAEILNFAVDPASRRRGIAGALLAGAIEYSRASGAKRLFLEVRESNSGATAFYRRHGFESAGKRPRYYQIPPEDALVLSLPL
jgi:[ribosomal protein S18]-alanine N-acetyltransferase